MGRKRNSDTLTPELKKVRLGELEEFCRSELFSQFSIIPVTPARAASYIRNPNGNPEDVVLLLFLFNGDLIAFRSLFAGVVCIGSIKIRFGWCSGSWVKPDYRRKGLSLRLLKEAYNDWNGRLMLTNYSPETEGLFLKTGLFNPIHQFKGARGYLFPKTAKLFPLTNSNTAVKQIFRLVDLMAELISGIRILTFRHRKPENVGFELLDHPDEESFNYIENFGKNYLFNLGVKELIWILESPWISESNRYYKARYPFSACSESFYYRTVKLRYNNELAGVSLFSVRDGHLKTLFVWVPPQWEAEMACFLKDITLKNKLEMITVYHQGIAEQLFAHKLPFLHVKKFGQKIYSSFAIPNGGSFVFRDGEGDYVFT